MTELSAGQITCMFVRAVHFSAGTRYAKGEWSEAENRRVYGSLFVEAGLGFNYKIEAFFTGPIDQESGMIENLSVIDFWMKSLVKPMDHYFLPDSISDLDVVTAENLARYSFEFLGSLMRETFDGTTRVGKSRVDPKVLRSSVSLGQVRLQKVRVHEGPHAFAEFGTI